MGRPKCRIIGSKVYDMGVSDPGAFPSPNHLGRLCASFSGSDGASPCTFRSVLRVRLIRELMVSARRSSLARQYFMIAFSVLSAFVFFS